MQPDKQLEMTRKWQKPVRELIIFSGFYLFVLYMVQPSLLYHSFGVSLPYPAFRLGCDFLTPFLNRPGGAIEYIGAFLSQWYYYSWIGAFVVTLTAWQLCRSFNRYLFLISQRRYDFLSSLPAVAVLIIQSQYTHPLNSLLAMLTALYSAVLYIKTAPKNKPTGIALFMLIFTVLYHLSGSAVILFAVLVMFYEILIRRSFIVGFFIPVFGMFLVWFWGVQISGLLWENVLPGMSISQIHGMLVQLKWWLITLMRQLFTPGLEVDLPITTPAIYVYVVFTALVVCLRNLLKSRQNQRTQKKSKAQKKQVNKTQSQTGQYHLIRWLLGTLVFVSMMLVCGYITFDSPKKKQHMIDHFVRHKQWDQILDVANDLDKREYDFIENHDINLALFHTGKLPEKMFEYSQKKESLFLIFEKERVSSRIFFKRAQLFLDMGFLAMAEKTAHEILEMTGDHPRAIELLAKINLARGQIETAKVFLTALSKNIVQAQYGTETLNLLDRDPQMSTDSEINRIRSMASDVDTTRIRARPERTFDNLLKKNPNNRMAFEYMMAYYLLTCQTDKIAANIHRLDNFGYKKLPRYYEEALVIHMGPKGDMMNIPARWRPGKEAFQRALDFNKTETAFGGNQKEAMQRMARDYGDSYYYYYIFKVSGVNRW